MIDDSDIEFKTTCRRQAADIFRDLADADTLTILPTLAIALGAQVSALAEIDDDTDLDWWTDLASKMVRMYAISLYRQ